MNVKFILVCFLAPLVTLDISDARGTNFVCTSPDLTLLVLSKLRFALSFDKIGFALV